MVGAGKQSSRSTQNVTTTITPKLWTRGGLRILFREVCEWDDSAKFSFDLKSLHSLACFWACEDGLCCRHHEYQKPTYVFQYLHSKRENVFFIITTRDIRCHLSKYVPKNKKDVTQEKLYTTIH